MKKYKCAISKIFLIGLMLFPVIVFAETFSDSLGSAGKLVASWLSSIGAQDVVVIVSALSGVIGYVFTRLFTLICKRTPTTWYWNPKTQTFVAGKLSQLLAGLFGKRILYYNSKFVNPDENSDIAEEQKKKIIQEYLQQHSNEITVEVK